MNRRTFTKLATLSTAQTLLTQSARAQVQPAARRPARGPLATKWTAEVTPANALPEYPRPGMVRQQWQNLNGLWDYCVSSIGNATRPETSAFTGKILVPFGIESQLSGVMVPFRPDQRLWYRCSFEVPSHWQPRRLLLHFDAVDFEATLWLNGDLLGTHKGGYDRFSFDITDSIRRNQAQEICVSVVDPTSAGDQAHGKQSLRPRGASYTATSGIWQTVWIEPVPDTYIASIKITPELDASRLRLSVQTEGRGQHPGVTAVALEQGRPIAHANGVAAQDLLLLIDKPRFWSPEDPFLYDLKVSITGGEAPHDSVTSYFGMRSISLGRNDQGGARLLLNGKPVFHQGPLDQGFWPDGIYTAPTDEALKFDLEYMKAVGFTAVRKHLKVEPERWYYWADKLGLLVWQDMPAGQLRTPESRVQWEVEMARHVENHFNHPSIVLWTIFNEGWGQYDTERLEAKLRKLDGTRLINNASGWYDKGCGDIADAHFYPGPSVCDPEEKRASVTGEFGGLGFVTAGHMWAENAWGYQTFIDKTSYNDTYQRLWQRVHKLRKENYLSAAIYTQITDVETESNGMLTYDRKVEKLDYEGARAAHLGQLPKLTYRTILAMSADDLEQWSYTSTQPDSTWMMPTYSDACWPKGAGGFGTSFGYPDFVRTKWNTTDLWIRRQFLIGPEGAHWPLLTCRFGVDFEVYINGVLACRPEGFHDTYGLYELNPPARATLQPGTNTIAVHVIQRAKGGQQYIDVGLVDEIASGAA